GTGTIAGNLSNAGTVLIDGAGAAATLTVTGNFTQTTGTLTVHVGLGDDGLGSDQFVVGGTAALGGTLSVLAPDGFGPSLGPSFAVSSAPDPGSVTGQFATLQVPDLGAELYLDAAYDTHGVSLVVKAH